MKEKKEKKKRKWKKAYVTTMMMMMMSKKKHRREGFDHFSTSVCTEAIGCSTAEAILPGRVFKQFLGLGLSY